MVFINTIPAPRRGGMANWDVGNLKTVDKRNLWVIGERTFPLFEVDCFS